jgi:hypothetical protein
MAQCDRKRTTSRIILIPCRELVENAKQELQAQRIFSTPSSKPDAYCVTAFRRAVQTFDASSPAPPWSRCASPGRLSSAIPHRGARPPELPPVQLRGNEWCCPHMELALGEQMDESSRGRSCSGDQRGAWDVHRLLQPPSMEQELRGAQALLVVMGDVRSRASFLLLAALPSNIWLGNATQLLVCYN